MKTYKPVAVPRAAFIFCRYTVAILIWLSLILRSEPILFAVFIILLLSAILKIRKAPMIWLYSHTINLIMKSKDEILNEHAMRFAHTMGSTLAAVCILLLTFAGERVGWIAVGVFAILKTVSALGFCPASKLYECTTGGTCCAFIKKHD